MGFSAVPAPAGIYGVPTNLNANGTTSATSVNPPGWFTLTDTGSADADGDTEHQIRFFIEVTGTTLDLRVFDPGNHNARDLIRTGNGQTDYTLFNPAAAAVSNTTITVDVDPPAARATDNGLVRFAPGNNGFYIPTDADPNNACFTGLAPGLYELRVTMVGGGQDVNAFGVDIRDCAGNHYNVYTIGEETGTQDTSWIGGALNSGAPVPPANVNAPTIFFPYVNRGCTVQTSNFDMDASAGAPGQGSSGTLTDTVGTATALTMGGGTVSAENTITFENAGATNLESNNYGMYSLRNDVAPVTQQNVVDWRLADFQGFSEAAGGDPRDTANPIRMYLPSGYAPVPGNANAVAPAEPILAASARVVSGTNPPQSGSVTRFTLTATVDNQTASTMSNVQITIPLVAGAVFVAGTQVSTIDGAAAACTDGSAAGFRRCTFATLAAGSVGSLNIDVDFTPSGGSGLKSLTGAPAAGTPPPNTTVWAQYNPAFATSPYSAAETEYVGPVCNLVINVINGGGVALATRATLRGLRVDRSGGRVEFLVGSQRNTAAFELFATDDPSGRSGRVRLGPPVPAAVPDSNLPLLYEVPTGPLLARYLVIEEIDARGRRRTLGPVDMDDARLRAVLGRVEEELDGAGARRIGRARVLGEHRASRLRRLATRDGGGRAERRRAARGVKIAVSRSGRVLVPLDDLRAAGLPDRGHLRGVRLFNLGREVPFDLVRGRQDAPEALAFRSESLSTAYSGRNVYVLTWNGAAPPPEAPLTRFVPPPAHGFTRVETSAIYVASAPQEADPWQWDLLFGDGSPWPYDDPDAGTFDLADIDPSGAGEAAVHVRLLGRTPHVHTVSAWINGHAVGTATFSGAVTAEIVGVVPVNALRAEGNQLTVTYSAEAAGEALVYLDAVDVAYPKAAMAPPVTADRIDGYEPGLPALRGVEYLIVTHASFRDQAERLAALQGRRGLRAAVVDVERAYDAFSSGIPEAAAVRALLRWAASRAPLRHVALMGDDTFDTRDDLGTGAVAYVPSLLGWDGEFGRVPSENLYADLDGDGAPELAIGRLPVQTALEAEALVDKIEAHHPAPRAAVQLIAVDNQAPGDASFRGEAEAAAALFPAGSRVAWADVTGGIEGARTALLDGLRQGPAVVHYFGHGGPEVWADEGLLTSEDAAGLAFSRPAGALFAWSCEAQWYQNLFGPSVNEALVLAPHGGATAAFGPAGITAPGLQRVLQQATYRHLFAGSSLGEAVRRAKREALQLDPSVRPVVEGWNLLGDPALRLTPGTDAAQGAQPPPGGSRSEARPARGGRL